MKTTVVCGILGSGKTTYIQNVVATASEDTVVLVNDFGKSGIDGEIFSGSGIQSVELPAGCVCCTLRVDLETTIASVIDRFRPERLYIEPSGVASPSGVLEVLDRMNLGSVTVIGIVDATEFCELYDAEMYGRFFEDQVACADVVLVNKTDLAGKEKTRQALALAKTLNPRAPIIPTVDALLPDLHLPPELPRRIPVTSTGRPAHALHLETASVALGDGVSYDRVLGLFRTLSQETHGNVRRAKALVNTDRGPYRFDLASGSIRTAALTGSVNGGRLVVIGADLPERFLTHELL